MGAISLTSTLTLFQTKHWKEQLFIILDCKNGRILQISSAKHVQGFIIVVNKHRERSIVHCVCYNMASIVIIIITSNTWERAIVQHIANNNGRKVKMFIERHVNGNIIMTM